MSNHLKYFRGLDGCIFLKIFIFSPGILYSYKYFKKKGLNFYKISLIHLDLKTFTSKNNPSLRVVIIYFHFLFISLTINLSKKSELLQLKSLPCQENQWDKIVHS